MPLIISPTQRLHQNQHDWVKSGVNRSRHLLKRQIMFGRAGEAKRTRSINYFQRRGAEDGGIAKRAEF